MLVLPAVVFAVAISGADVAQPGWPEAGEKVRVTTFKEQGRRKGVVVQADAESLTVSLDPRKPPVRIPLGSIARLEVARGQRNAAREGALWGGTTGIVLGALAVTGLSRAMCDYGSDCSASMEGYLVGMSVVGAAGVGIGALTGLAIKADRWERVPFERVRVGVQPVPGGAGVQVSFGWR